jgi:hypothetical protein
MLIDLDEIHHINVQFWIVKRIARYRDVMRTSMFAWFAIHRVYILYSVCMVRDSSRLQFVFTMLAASHVRISHARRHQSYNRES